MVAVSVVIPFGGEWLLFSLPTSLGSCPPSRTQGWVWPPDPSDFFLFPPLVPSGELVLLLWFWFCHFFGNRDGEGAREGDNSACRGVGGVRHKANKSALSVSIPQPESEPEIQWRRVEPVTRQDQILRSKSLLPSPFKQLLCLNTRFL